MSIGKRILYFILIFITMFTVSIVGALLPISTGYIVLDIIFHVMMVIDLEVCAGIFCIMVASFIESLQCD